ncbi:MAG: hypothetical protein HOC20_11125 [Chloroflexi bacterium]|jgi:hypothetical protein|nr:hypothetical protein [Chloroflexota bacterium]
MVERKGTPDILGDLLSVGKPPKREPEDISNSGLNVEAASVNKDQPVAKQPSVPVNMNPTDIEAQFAQATNTLALLAPVVGSQRLLEWLDDMRNTLGRKDRQSAQSIQAKPNIAAWVKQHLSARMAAVDHMATGLLVNVRYNVDVWARINCEQFNTEYDLWVEYREKNASIKTKDIYSLVRKGIDVFYAARAHKRDFWFDRLMLVSSSPFDLSTISLAEDYGVICVLYDGTDFEIKTDIDWQLKPTWLRHAEEALEGLQG